MSPKKETGLWSSLAQPKWIFRLIRGSFFLSFAFWMLFSPEYDHRLWIALAFFLVYSSVVMLLGKRADEEKLYVCASLLDVILITIVMLLTDREGSGFFFLYFLVAFFGSYVAGLLPGLSLALLSSVFYLSINARGLSSLSASSVLLKFLALWTLTAVVGVVVKEMKYSRSRLLRTFDILNQRTSELEKSQAQIETIYETSRTLGEKLNTDEVVGEILNIVQKILRYSHFSLFTLAGKESLSLLGEIKQGERIRHSDPQVRRLKGILRGVVSTGKPVRTLNSAEDKKLEIEIEGASSFMAVPMISRGKVIGVMDARSTRIGAFLEQDEKIFSILAESAALAIENALLHQQTEELTIVDELTGVHNYRYFTRKVRIEVRRAERYHQPLSLVMIDIDWFKRCNDTHGHLFGNRVLQELAARIKESVRDVDVVCRYGGEEFAVILPQTKKADARMIGERIRHRVESSGFGDSQDGSTVKITVSLGIASFPENGRSSRELIEKMDQALYLAKGAGKNQVCTA
ncbi:MAG: sensor domain-containing diguanylate cyclase [Candidatus Zixiibacteriota bacterium]